MTSARSSRYLLVLLGTAVLLGVTASGHCQRPERRKYVDVLVIDADQHIWEVPGVKDKCFLLQRPHDGRDYTYPKNFQKGDDWMEVGGFHLAYDLEGKTKDVLARERYGENTRWEVKRVDMLQARLQVRNGNLKGWWVGVRVIKEKAEAGKPALAGLVLVKDEKGAAIFSWDDPLDISP